MPTLVAEDRYGLREIAGVPSYAASRDRGRSCDYPIGGCLTRRARCRIIPFSSPRKGRSQIGISAISAISGGREYLFVSEVRGKAFLLQLTVASPALTLASDTLYIAKISLYPSVLALEEWYMFVAFDEMALAAVTVVARRMSKMSYGPGCSDGVDRRGIGSDILSFFLDEI